MCATIGETQRLSKRKQDYFRCNTLYASSFTWQYTCVDASPRGPGRLNKLYSSHQVEVTLTSRNVLYVVGLSPEESRLWNDWKIPIFPGMHTSVLKCEALNLRFKGRDETLDRSQLVASISVRPSGAIVSYPVVLPRFMAVTSFIHVCESE